MKKITIRIVCILIIMVLFILLPKQVQANSISSIEMDIYIDKNGDANITEIWKCNATQGTEVYHPYYNLGKSKITNLTVKDGNTEYTTLNYWNTSGTINSKANKCGLNYISDGIEICWGISSYGSHTYTVNYTITNFVSELTDSQMVYWTLIPHNISDSIGRAYIKIHTYYNLPSTTDVWGYGNYGGTCYVYNGIIEMESNGNLNSNEYMTILAKFPVETFNTSSKLNHNFEYYFSMAEEGAEEYVLSSNNNSNLENAKVLIIVYLFGITCIVSVIIPLMIESNSNIIKTNRKNIKNVPYYREIPCNKDIFRAYVIAQSYGLTLKKIDLLSAVILKWLKDGNVEIGKKEKECIILKDSTNITNNFEKSLYDMIYKASKDGILESKELEKWCANKYSRILGWFNEINSQEIKKLFGEGKIHIKQKNKFNREGICYASEELDEEAKQLAGLKKYLDEYTLIKDREAIEVTLFEEYLIYAQIFGIAKKVASQFKKLYPDLVEKSKYSYNEIIFIDTISHKSIKNAQSAEKSARARATSVDIANGYDSGGGGFSSGGGRRRVIWTVAVVVAGGFR